MGMGRSKKDHDPQATISGADVAPSTAWDGPTWECVVVPGGFTGSKLHGRINEMGAQGWEPFAAMVNTAGTTEVYMKRRTR